MQSRLGPLQVWSRYVEIRWTLTTSTFRSRNGIHFPAKSVIIVYAAIWGLLKRGNSQTIGFPSTYHSYNVFCFGVDFLQNHPSLIILYLAVFMVERDFPKYGRSHGFVSVGFLKIQCFVIIFPIEKNDFGLRLGGNPWMAIMANGHEWVCKQKSAGSSSLPHFFFPPSVSQLFTNFPNFSWPLLGKWEIRVQGLLLPAPKMAREFQGGPRPLPGGALCR